MVSGTEIARLIEEFQISAGKAQNIDLHHHEQKRHKQLVFACDVKTLRETIKEMGNPFTEDSSDLLILDSINIVDIIVQRICAHICWNCAFSDRSILLSTLL